MICVFCKSDELIERNDFPGGSIRQTNTVVGAEYYCGYCRRYFYWAKGYGIYETDGGGRIKYINTKI